MPFPAHSRVRLTKEIPEVDLLRGELGRIVEVLPADDTRCTVIFDSRPGLRVDFYWSDFQPNSPQRCIEVIYHVERSAAEPIPPLPAWMKRCGKDPECLLDDGHTGECYVDEYL